MPALIITNWPGRASRATRGGGRSAGRRDRPSASRATRDAVRLAGIRPILSGRARAAKRRTPRFDRGAPFGYASARARPHARERRPRGLVGAALLSSLALYLNPGLVLRGERPRSCSACSCPGRSRARCCSRSSRRPRARSAARRAFPPLLRKLPCFTSLAFVARLARRPALLAQPAQLSPFAARRGPARAALSATVVTERRGSCCSPSGSTPLFFPARERSAAAALVVLAPRSPWRSPLALRPASGRPRPSSRSVSRAAPSARRIMLVGIDGLEPRADLTGGAVRGGGALAFAQMAPRRAWRRWPRCAPRRARRSGPRIFTGRFPRDHGVKSFDHLPAARARRRCTSCCPRARCVGLLERARLAPPPAVTSASRKRRALWNVLDAFGIPTGIVRVLGHPPARARSRASCSRPTSTCCSQDPARAASALHPRDLAEARCRARAVEGGRHRPRRCSPASSTSRAARLRSADPRLAGELARARARARPHLPAGGRGAARRLRPALLRHLLPRARRGRATRFYRASRSPRPSATCGPRSAPLRPRARALRRAPRRLAADWQQELAARRASWWSCPPTASSRCRSGGGCLGDADAATRVASGTHADAPDGAAAGHGGRQGRCCGRLRARRRAHDPLPDGPAGGARHGRPLLTEILRRLRAAHP